MTAFNLAETQARVFARVHGAHQRLYPDCRVWKSYTQPFYMGRSRTPIDVEGIGCPVHNVWTMTPDADAR